MEQTIKSGAFYMNYSKLLLRKTLWLTLAFGMAVLGTGCSIKAARTVGLPGLKPLASADQVKLIEKLEEVRQPYQIVGQVRLASDGTLYEDVSYKRMKEIAAGMGADGLIGLHQGYDRLGVGYFRSGLAVKWLAPGETRKAPAVPFIVAVLPVQDQTAPDKEFKFSEQLRGSVLCQLEPKGYYVLLVQPDNFKGGIEKAKALGDTELRAVGGEDAQLLLSVTIETSTTSAVAHLRVVGSVVGEGSKYFIRTAILNKQTRKTVFEQVGAGNAEVGWLVNAIVQDEKLNAAARVAAWAALDKLRAINEEVCD